MYMYKTNGNGGHETKIKLYTAPSFKLIFKVVYFYMIGPSPTLHDLVLTNHHIYQVGAHR